MKKFLKFILGVGAVIGGVAGVLYFMDKRHEDDDVDDFDDDDFDSIFDDDDMDDDGVDDDDADDRDYVTLDLENEEN